MRTKIFLFALLLVSTSLSQMLGSRNNGNNGGNPRHSSTLKPRARPQNQNGQPTTPPNPQNDQAVDRQHQTLVTFTKSIRKMGKDLEKMKKRENFLKTQIKNGINKRRDIKAREARVNNFSNRVQQTKKQFERLYKSYSSLLTNASKRIAKEGQNLNQEEKNVKDKLEKLRFNVRKHEMDFSKLKQDMRKREKNLQEKVKKGQKEVNKRTKQLMDSKETLKQLSKIVQNADEIKNKQKQLEVLSELRNKKNTAMSKIDQKIDQASSLFGPLPANMPKVDIRTDAQNQKLKDLMLCVHSFREQIELLRNEISEDADLANTFKPDDSCLKVSASTGLRENGCFRVAIVDFTELAKTARKMLSAEALTNFEEFKKEISETAKKMKEDMKEKCVQNEELIRNNKKCADTISEIFSGLVDSSNSDGYMNFIEMNEGFESIMEDDFWVKVNDNCNN